jgi:hypothetical protein
VVGIAFYFRDRTVFHSGKQPAADAAVGAVGFLPPIYSVVLNSSVLRV